MLYGVSHIEKCFDRETYFFGSSNFILLGSSHLVLREVHLCRFFIKMFDLLIAGLFCQHVIAIFEHIRLDKIPGKYILQRYSNEPVTNPECNRRDYLQKEGDETTLQYR